MMHGTDSEDVALDLSEEDVAYEYFDEAWAAGHDLSKSRSKPARQLSNPLAVPAALAPDLPVALVPKALHIQPHAKLGR